MRLHTYHVFGVRITSSIPLPELRPAPPGPAPWHFEVVDALADPVDIVLMGEEPIYGEVAARLYRHAHGHRIEVDDTGRFDLAPRPGGGAMIRWCPLEDPWWDFGRAHLLGRVMATLLHLEGRLTLHGSAVGLSEGVVAFLAPKHHGKSTLSRALYEAGARFVTDDALPVDPGPPTRAFPGVQSLRVIPGGEGTPGGVAEADGALTPVGRDGKVTLPPVPEARALLEPAPLAALYLLAPQRPGSTETAVARTRLPGVLASALLVGQTKIGAMLGGGEAGVLLDRASEIVRTVPLWRLDILRELERLPEVVETLIAWHGGLPPSGHAPDAPTEPPGGA